MMRYLALFGAVAALSACSSSEVATGSPVESKVLLRAANGFDVSDNLALLRDGTIWQLANDSAPRRVDFPGTPSSLPGASGYVIASDGRLFHAKTGPGPNSLNVTSFEPSPLEPPVVYIGEGALFRDANGDVFDAVSPNYGPIRDAARMRGASVCSRFGCIVHGELRLFEGVVSPADDSALAARFLDLTWGYTPVDSSGLLEQGTYALREDGRVITLGSRIRDYSGRDTSIPRLFSTEVGGLPPIARFTGGAFEDREGTKWYVGTGGPDAFFEGDPMYRGCRQIGAKTSDDVTCVGPVRMPLLRGLRLLQYFTSHIPRFAISEGGELLCYEGTAMDQRQGCPQGMP